MIALALPALLAPTCSTSARDPVETADAGPPDIEPEDPGVCGPGAEYRQISPGPDEYGDRYVWYLPGPISRITLTLGQLEHDATGAVRVNPACGLLPTELLVWDALSVLAPQRYEIALDHYGRVTIDLVETVGGGASGRATIALVAQHNGKQATCIAHCRRADPIAAGWYYWCRRDSGECLDMAWGGGSPAGTPTWRYHPLIEID